jgi:hypothetical protein
MPITTEEGAITESGLAKRWNVRLPELALIRQTRFRENYHWYLDQARSTVMITREGQEEFQKWITPVPKKDPPLPPARDAPLSETVVEIVRLPANPTMLIARDGLKRFVSVRVRNSGKFRKGMKLDLSTQCERLPSNRSDYLVYRFTGLYPRFYGRW